MRLADWCAPTRIILLRRPLVNLTIPTAKSATVAYKLAFLGRWCLHIVIVFNFPTTLLVLFAASFFGILIFNFLHCRFKHILRNTSCHRAVVGIREGCITKPIKFCFSTRFSITTRYGLSMNHFHDLKLHELFDRITDGVATWHQTQHSTQTKAGHGSMVMKKVKHFYAVLVGEFVFLDLVLELLYHVVLVVIFSVFVFLHLIGIIDFLVPIIAACCLGVGSIATTIVHGLIVIFFVFLHSIGFGCSAVFLTIVASNVLFLMVFFCGIFWQRCSSRSGGSVGSSYGGSCGGDRHRGRTAVGCGSCGCSCVRSCRLFTHRRKNDAGGGTYRCDWSCGHNRCNFTYRRRNPVGGTCSGHWVHSSACIGVGIVSWRRQDKTLMMRHVTTRTSSTRRRKSASKHLVNFGHRMRLRGRIIRSNSGTNWLFVQNSSNVSCAVWSDEKEAKDPNHGKDSVHDSQKPKKEIGNHCRRYKIDWKKQQQNLFLVSA